MAKENYSKDPAKELEGVLRSCYWRRAGKGLWEKEACRLYIDEIGCFLYRLLNNRWVRTHGRSHNLITHLPERRIRFDDFTLNLLNPQ